jgi:transcriptional regulator with XRE-family HTH domain
MINKNENIKVFRTYLGLTQIEMAEVLGIQQGSYAKIELGVNSLTGEHIITMIKKYNFNPTWYFTGEGEMILEKKVPYTPSVADLYALAVPIKDSKIDYRKSSYVLPFFESASAGYIVGWGDITHDIYYESYLLPTHIEQLVRGFVVIGDSMSPFLNREDIVFCRRILDPQMHNFNILNIYVVISHQGILVKRIRDKGDSFILISENKRYPEFDLHKAEIYEVWMCEKCLFNMVHSA